MGKKEHKISAVGRKRFEQQGFINFSDKELYDSNSVSGLPIYYVRHW